MRRRTRAAALVGVVAVHAGLQAVPALGDPEPSGGGVLVRAAVSGVAVLVALVAVTLLVSGGRRVVPVTGVAVLLLASSLVAALVHPLAPGPVALVGAALLPAAAVGLPARGLLALPARHPVATLAWVVGVTAVLVVSRTVDVLAGLLLATPVGTAAAWVVAGITAAAVLGVTSALLPAPGRPDARPAPDRAATGSPPGRRPSARS